MPTKSATPVSSGAHATSRASIAQQPKIEHGNGGNGSVEHVLDLRKVAAIVKKNWMVLKADKIRLIMLSMFPIIMILIYGFTAGSSPKLVAAGIVDYDHSFYSQQAQSYLYSSNLFSIGHVLGSQDEGKTLIDRGEIKVLFIIPPGFGADIAAGRTSTLSFIVDVSDPTIAQITRASIQAFVQQFSGNIAAMRIQEIGAQAGIANAYLTSASRTLANSYSIGSATEIDTLNFAYSDSMRTSSKTISSMSSGIMALKNSMGEPVDQNAIADSFNYASDPKATLTLLANGDAQSSAMQQIGVYQGILGSSSRVASDASKMHGAAMSIALKSQQNKAAMAATAKLVGSATGPIAKIQTEVAQYSPTPVAIEEIQPYGVGRAGLDFLIPSILALIIFQGAVMGLGRAVAGERQDGSLTRVFLTPTSNVTIITGTLLFYILFETVRSSLIVLIAMMLFGVAVKGSLFAVLIMIAIYAAGSTGLGMVLSVIAKSQEQYQSIAMLFSLPIMFLSGVFLPIETMPAAIKGIALILPVTYMSDAMRGIIIKGFGLEMLLPDIAFLSAFALVTVGLSVLLFKRELM